MATLLAANVYMGMLVDKGPCFKSIFVLACY